MDGVVVAQQTVIVVLGSRAPAARSRWVCAWAPRRTAVVCTELLQDLLARGLTLAGRVLWVIDGGKGLRKALAMSSATPRSFNAASSTRRVPRRPRPAGAPGLRPDEPAPGVSGAQYGGGAAAADGAGDVAGAERSCRCRRQYAGGLEETLTVLKLGLPPTLRRFFATTNCIENLIGTVRHVTRNIKALARWRHAAAVDRARSAARRGALPAHQAARRAGRARDRARRRESRGARRVSHRGHRGENRGPHLLRIDLLEGAAMSYPPPRRELRV